MKLVNLLDTQERLQVLMIQNIFKHGGQLSIVQLSKELQVSYNTISNNINKIIELSRPFSPKIIWSKKNGNLTVTTQPDYPISNLISVYYQHSININLLFHLLINPNHSNIQLANKLYISPSSLQRRIKDINQQIQEFHVQIKNNELVGPELQIRYCFYQIFSKTAHLKNTKKHFELLAMQLEKNVFHFTHDTIQDPINDWLTISYYRQFSNNTKTCELFPIDYTKQVFQQKDNYLIIKNTLSKQSYLKDDDILYLYLFILSLAVIQPDSIAQHTYFSNNLPFKSTIDTLNKTAYSLISDHFKDIVIEPDTINSLLYGLTQAHLQLMLFDGFCIYFDQDDIINKQTVFFDNRLDYVSQELTMQIIPQCPKKISKDAEYALTNRYLSLLFHAIFTSTHPFRVGIYIYDNFFVQNFITQYFVKLFRNHEKIKLAPFSFSESYDFIITNSNKYVQTFNCPYYQLTGFGNQYDIDSIKKIILNLSK